MSYDQSENTEPLFWVQGRPIYANTLLLILHILGCVIASLCMAIWAGSGVFRDLILDTQSVDYGGQVWRLATYVIFPPSLNFIFGLGLLYFSGREVERYLGRGKYLVIYAALVLVPAVLFCLWGLYRPSYYQGGWESIFGVFIAFATLYPGVMFNIWFVNLTTKHWAFVILAVYSLFDLANHDLVSLYFLWACALIGYGSVRLLGAGYGFAWITDWLDERRTQRLARQHNIKVVEKKKATDSIDAILEKISKQGVNSLNAGERAALERASANLKRGER